MEAACRSHGRRNFFVLATLPASRAASCQCSHRLPFDAVRLLDAHEIDRLKFFGVIVLIAIRWCGST
jgi:hypothetical protein